MELISPKKRKDSIESKKYAIGFNSDDDEQEIIKRIKILKKETEVKLFIPQEIWNIILSIVYPDILNCNWITFPKVCRSFRKIFNHDSLWKLFISNCEFPAIFYNFNIIHFSICQCEIICQSENQWKYQKEKIPITNENIRKFVIDRIKILKAKKYFHMESDRFKGDITSIASIYLKFGSRYLDNEYYIRECILRFNEISENIINPVKDFEGYNIGCWDIDDREDEYHIFNFQVAEEKDLFPYGFSHLSEKDLFPIDIPNNLESLKISLNILRYMKFQEIPEKKKITRPPSSAGNTPPYQSSPYELTPPF
jgi:hypothetical protein